MITQTKGFSSWSCFYEKICPSTTWKSLPTWCCRGWKGPLSGWPQEGSLPPQLKHKWTYWSKRFPRVNHKSKGTNVQSFTLGETLMESIKGIEVTSGQYRSLKHGIKKKYPIQYQNSFICPWWTLSSTEGNMYHECFAFKTSEFANQQVKKNGWFIILQDSISQWGFPYHSYR